MQPHEKWLLGLIITSMSISLLLFCISMVDLFGVFSFFLSPVACILTEIFHSVSLPVWKHTYKKRRNQPKTTSIYSIASIVLTGLLAFFWLVTAILYAAISGSVAATYGVSLALPGVETAFAWIGMAVLWAEFGVQIHFRKKTLKQFKQGQPGSHNQQQQPKLEVAYPPAAYYPQGPGPWNQPYQPYQPYQLGPQQMGYPQYPGFNQQGNQSPPPLVNQQGQGPNGGALAVTSFVEKSNA